MRDLYTRPPYIPGPPKSPYRSSLQDLFTSPIWDISIQDFLIYLDLLGLFRGALYKILSQDLHYRSLRKSSTRSQHRTPMRDPCTRALYKISSQGLYQRSLREISITGALYKISAQNLYQTRPYERSLHKISWYLSTSWQDLSKRPLDMRPLKRPFHKIFSQDLLKDLISIQDLLKSLDHPDRLTGALYKISSQAPKETSLYKISWYPWTS